MGFLSKFRPSRAAAPSVPLVPSVSSSVDVVSEPKKLTQPKNLSWYKIYEAADRADYKGWFFLPTLQPAEQLNYISRRAIIERIDYLYKNVGAVSLVINGLAMEEVGTGLWPKWVTSSPEFNTAMTDRYHYAVHDPRIFSSDGESDGYTAQYNIRRMIRLYGDCFGQFLRPGPGAIMPQMHLIPGWRVDNATGASASADTPGFRDGILRSELGRATFYQVLNKEFGQIAQTIPADDILHFHDPFLPGQNRGVSCLASVCKKLFRREDILKALNNGTLAREKLGFALQTKDDQGAVGPTLEELTGDGAAETVTNADGTTYSVARLFGDDADEKISIPRLPGNSEIKTIESNRPGTAVTEFLDSMLREVAWGADGYPPEYLFFKGGLGQGTVARLVLQQVSSIIRAKRAQQLIPQFCNRWHVFFAWQLIKNGGMKGVQIPEDWWKHKVLGDADKSVDIGREGRLYDDRVATGKMGIEHYHALMGEDASDVEDENNERIKARIKKLNALNSDPEVQKSGMKFEYFDIWPRSTSNPQVQLKGPPDPAEE